MTKYRASQYPVVEYSHIIAITVTAGKMNFPDRDKLEFLLPRGRSPRGSIFESLSRSGCIFPAVTDIIFFFFATFSLIGPLFVIFTNMYWF